MLSPIADVKTPSNGQPEGQAAHQGQPTAAFGPAGNIPPQVALFKVAHYVVNYLELAEIVVEVIYDLLADRRKFTFTSGDLVRSAFDISERDILERWADVEPTTLDAMTPENAHTIGNLPKIWPALFDFLYFSTGGNRGLTTLFLRWIHNAMSSALEDADFPVLYQFQLNLLDQWFSMPHDSGTGITFDQLLQLLKAVAAFRAIVDEVLNFSFEDLKFTQQVSGAVSIKIDGVVDITLPEDAANFLSWSLNGDTYRIGLHFDEIVMADGSEFALIVDNPYVKLRFPFSGSTNALRFTGVDVALVIDPEHGPAQPEVFAPYHRFRDAYFSERPGERLAALDIDVDDVSFSLESTVLTTVLSAGVAYIDLWSNDDIDDLATLLGEAAAGAVRNLDDIGGLAGKMAGALAAVVPNALACSTHDIHKPYLNDHYLLKYDRIRARAENGALIVFNEPPPVPEPADDSDGPLHFPPPDSIDWPGILDEIGPGPNGGGGGGRPSRLLDPVVLDAIRIPAGYRAEYERRLAAAGRVSPRQFAAARLLIDGLDLRTVRFLNQRQINLSARTVAGVPVSQPTIEALKRLSPTGGATGSFLFAAGGQVPTPSAIFATAFTPLTQKMARPEISQHFPSVYSAESTLDARRGLAVDPGWIGLSVNSYAVDKVLSFVAEAGLLATSGRVTIPTSSMNPAPPTQVYEYETRATDALRLVADLDGDDGTGPTAVLTGLEVTLSRLGASVTYKVVARTPLQATHLQPGCLPDAMLMSVVQYAGCVGRLTGGSIADEDYRDDLLYRHFVYLEPLDISTLVTEVELVEGDPGALAKGGFEPRPVLAAAIRDVWATRVVRVPALFDPYYALSPAIDSFEARDGWLNVYEHYALDA